MKNTSMTPVLYYPGVEQSLEDEQETIDKIEKMMTNMATTFLK